MRRLLALVSAVVFVDTLLFSALTPLLPHFTEVFQLSKAGAGVLTGSYAAGALVAAIPSGWLASRWGAKPTVMVGLAMIATSSIVFGFAENLPTLNVARFGQGVGSALAWTGAFTWLVAEAPRPKRGEFLGIAVGAAVFGGMLGPVLGVIAGHVGTRPAFTGVALGGALLVLWAWKTSAAGPEMRQPMRAMLWAIRDRRVLGGAWFLLLGGLLFGLLAVVGPLDLDALGWDSEGIGAVFLIAAAIEAVVNPALGRWSDRRGRLAPLRLGLIASIVLCLTLPWINDRWVLAVAVVMTAVSFGVLWVPGIALLSDGAEATGLDQALGFALMNLAWTPGNVLGSAGGGAIADATSELVPCIIVAIISGLTLLATREGTFGPTTSLVESSTVDPTGAQG